MKRLSFAALVAAASVLILAVPAPANAARPLVEHWEDHQEHIEQEEHLDPPWCPDLEFDVLYVEDAWGTFRFQQRGDGLYYGGSTFTREFSWTNVETGTTFSGTSHGVEKDLHVTDNGDGTITIEVLNAGTTTYRHDDGDRMFVDSGRNFFSIVIDTNGTPDDPEDDEFVEFIGADPKGHFETADRDFCADMEAFLG